LEAVKIKISSMYYLVIGWSLLILSSWSSYTTKWTLYQS